MLDKPVNIVGELDACILQLLQRGFNDHVIRIRLNTRLNPVWNLKGILNEVCDHVEVLLDLDEAIAAYEVLEGHLGWQVHPGLNQVEVPDLLVLVEELALFVNAVIVLVEEAL